MKHLSILFVALTLTACADNAEKGISAAEGALYSCETFETAWSQLVPYRAQGKLSGSQVRLVDQAVAVVEPYCLGPAPDVNSNIKNVAVSAGVGMLQGVLAIVIGE